MGLGLRDGRCQVILMSSDRTVDACCILRKEVLLGNEDMLSTHSGKKQKKVVICIVGRQIRGFV